MKILTTHLLFQIHANGNEPLGKEQAAPYNVETLHLLEDIYQVAVWGLIPVQIQKYDCQMHFLPNQP